MQIGDPGIKTKYFKMGIESHYLSANFSSDLSEFLCAAFIPQIYQCRFIIFPPSHTTMNMDQREDI